MRKGMTVKLNIDKCFTINSGGHRQYPAGTRTDDERGIFLTYRPLTEREATEWRQSPASMGMNESGETKLTPTCVGVEIHTSDTFIIRRARCAVRLDHGSPTGGMMEVRLSSGELTYIKRDMVLSA